MIEPQNQSNEINQKIESAESPKLNNLEANEALVADNISKEQISVDQTQAAQIVAQAPISDNQIDADLTEEDKKEIVEEFSDDVEKSTSDWAKKAGEVIKEFEDEPYKEAEESEELQIDYMKSRFGVDISKGDNK